MRDNEMYILIVSAIVVEAICVAILFFTKRGGKNIKIWYEKYRVGAYLFDVLSLIIGSLIAILFTGNLYIQLFTVVLVGLAHDLTFGYFINKSKPKSGISKLFFDYAKEVKWKILVVDALLLLSTVITFNYLKTIDTRYLGLIGSILAYVGLYIVYSFTS